MRKFENKLAGYDAVILELQEALLNIGGLYDRVDGLERATADLPVIRESIRTMSTDITNLTNLVNSNYSDLDSRIREMEHRFDEIDEKIVNLRSYLIGLLQSAVKDIEAEFIEFSNYFYSAIYSLKEEIDEAIKNIITSFKNPWRPELGDISVKRNFYYAYNDLADECLTASQYCRLGLSASDYSSYGLSARIYTEFGKTKLHWRWVYSPTFGWRQEISNVLCSIIDSIRGTLSASRYSELDIDASTYTALELTASEYYSYGSQEGYLHLGGSGLTATQYGTITT